MKVKLIVALFLLPLLIPAISAQFDVPEWEPELELRGMDSLRLIRTLFDLQHW